MNHRSIFLCLVCAAGVVVLAKTAGPVIGRPDPIRPATTATLETQLMETVGLLASTQLYQTYLNIGFIADARTEGIYDDEVSVKLLASVLKSLEKVDQRLEALAKAARKKTDQAALIRLQKVTRLLRTQGKHLQTIWTGGNSADEEKYQAARKLAWKELSDLLKLDDEE